MIGWAFFGFFAGALAGAFWVRRSSVLHAILAQHLRTECPDCFEDLTEDLYRKAAAHFGNPVDQDLSTNYFGTALDRLNELSLLVAGWDSYDAPAPSPVSISQAKQIVIDLKITALTVSPSLDGGILISSRFGAHFIEFEIHNDGSTTLSVEEPDLP